MYEGYSVRKIQHFINTSIAQSKRVTLSLSISIPDAQKGETMLTETMPAFGT